MSRVSSQKDPWATWNSSASLANSVNQRRCLCCGPKKVVIYCIVAGVNNIQKRIREHRNTIMIINILVTEKGGPGPWAPLLDPPPIIYAISKFHGVMHTWSCVQEVCACARRPVVGSPESAVMSSEVQNGVYKASGGCFARFLRCVKVYHNLDHLDMLYRGIHAYCSL